MDQFILLLSQATKDTLQLLFEAGTFFSVFIGIVIFRWNRKQNYFSAVQACQKRFTDIAQKQQRLDLQVHTMNPNRFYDEHLILFRDHLGLVCEEIFYIRQGTLPKAIAYSWLAEMAKRVPYYDNDEKELLNKELLKNSGHKNLATARMKVLEDTFRHFESLRPLFKESDPKNKINFDAKGEAWTTERKKFAHLMYLKIRGTKSERFRNFFRSKWKYGRW